MANRTQDREVPSAQEVANEAKKKQRAEDYNLLRPEAGAEFAMVSAVAKAVVDAKVKHPGTRRQVLDAVAMRLTRDQMQGKSAPKVKVYDKDAPAKNREKDQAQPVAQKHTERDRSR